MLGTNRSILVILKYYNSNRRPVAFSANKIELYKKHSFLFRKKWLFQNNAFKNQVHSGINGKYLDVFPCT